jgi:hypothetical protein
MTGAWNASTDKPSLAARMAYLALRAQRLIMLQRLEQLDAMIRSQALELRRIPGGIEAVGQAQQQLQEARRLLVGSSGG